MSIKPLKIRSLTWILLIFAGILLLYPSCRPEIDFVEDSFRPGPAEVSLSGGNLSVIFGSAAGSASVDLEASRKWTAAFVNDRAKDWCSLSTESGKRGTVTITISVKENAEYDQRSASILFVCGDAQRTIVVTQKQKDALLLTSNRQDVGKDGGRITVEVQSNVRFNYAISEDAESWITPVGTKGLTTSVLSFQAAANEEIEKREGAITITSTLGAETVQVYQEGATPTLIVSSSRVELSASDTTFRVEVRSNVDVSVEIPESCTWLREARTKAMSTNTFYFEADENEAFKSRETAIVFRNAKQGLEETLSVVQAAATPLIIIGQMEYEFEPEGGDLAIEVTSNMGLTVSVPDSCNWIQQLRTKSLQTRTYAFVIPENEAFTSREGKIIFRNEEQGVEEVVTITQKPSVPTLIIGQTKYEFEPEGGDLSVKLSSNMDLTVNVQPGCDWLVPVKTKAVTERTHSFVVGKNHSRHDRTAWIVFQNKAENQSDTVLVSQSFQPILVPCDTLRASGRGWKVAFETVGANPQDYRISPKDKWLSLDGREGLSNGSRFVVSVQAMDGNSKDRASRILVYYKDFSEPDTVWVRQFAVRPVFSYTTTARKVTVPEVEQEGQFGFVFWGDDTQEAWQEGLTHTYKANGTHTVTIEINNKKRVPFNCLENGMTINLRDLRK